MQKELSLYAILRKILCELNEQVADNRRGVPFTDAVDMHIGPVADDNVYQSIRFFETGILNAEETVKRLKTEVLHDQWTFHTEKILTYCQFIDFKEVR